MRRTAAVVVFALAAACVGGGSPQKRASVTIEDAPRRDGYPVVLVALPPTRDARDAWNSLRDELEPDFDVVTLRVAKDTSVDTLGAKIAATKPACIVLMNNPTVRLYRDYQRAQGTNHTYPPAVVMMASFAHEIEPTIVNATAIAYEVPAVTSFVQLRELVEHRIAKVGVVHRPAFAPFVARQRSLAQAEDLDLVAVQVGKDPTPKDLSRALRTLRRDLGVDALWVLNDNALLSNRKLLTKAWLPELHEAKWPVVVGVASLVNAKIRFGTYAVVPDHEALGVQAANLIYQLADEEWAADDHPVEQPLSVRSTIDLQQARELLRFREEMLSRIDRIVE